MQRLIDGKFKDCDESDLTEADVYRIAVGGGGWQQQQYSSEPLELAKSKRKIHKSDFIKRMLPYWADVRDTRQADPIVDGYFEMFNFYKYVDLDWEQTVAMLNDMEARVKAVNPETEFTAEALLVDGEPEELI